MSVACQEHGNISRLLAETAWRGHLYVGWYARSVVIFSRLAGLLEWSHIYVSWHARRR